MSDKASNPRAIIRCTDLGKSYRMGDSIVQVLKGLDMSVKPGEFLAIEGRSVRARARCFTCSERWMRRIRGLSSTRG
jgi:predicted ABC-type transport system involved in lysophospholipase L1 biosynthesis ATPase subunit